MEARDQQEGAEAQLRNCRAEFSALREAKRKVLLNILVNAGQAMPLDIARPLRRRDVRSMKPYGLVDFSQKLRRVVRRRRSRAGGDPSW